MPSQSRGSHRDSRTACPRDRQHGRRPARVAAGRGRDPAAAARRRPPPLRPGRLHGHHRAGHRRRRGRQRGAHQPLLHVQGGPVRGVPAGGRRRAAPNHRPDAGRPGARGHRPAASPTSARRACRASSHCCCDRPGTRGPTRSGAPCWSVPANNWRPPRVASGRNGQRTAPAPRPDGPRRRHRSRGAALVDPAGAAEFRHRTGPGRAAARPGRRAAATALEVDHRDAAWGGP